MDIARSETTVNLHDRRLTDADAPHLVALLREGRVTKLLLTKNELGDATAHALAGCLKQTRTLTCLGLASNRITDRGAAALAEALSTNEVLTSLYLFDNLMSRDGETALTTANALRSTPMSGLTGLVL